MTDIIFWQINTLGIWPIFGCFLLPFAKINRNKKQPKIGHIPKVFICQNIISVIAVLCEWLR
jgi:hypothetical protein